MCAFSLYASNNANAIWRISKYFFFILFYCGRLLCVKEREREHIVNMDEWKWIDFFFVDRWIHATESKMCIKFRHETILAQCWAFGEKKNSSSSTTFFCAFLTFNQSPVNRQIHAPSSSFTHSLSKLAAIWFRRRKIDFERLLFTHSVIHSALVLFYFFAQCLLGRNLIWERERKRTIILAKWRTEFESSQKFNKITH